MRSAVLRGGAALAVREALGVVIRLGGILVLTRILGPTRFGLYAGSLVIVAVLGVIASLGAEVYLPRSEAEPSRQAYDETVGSLLVSASIVAALACVVIVAGRGLLPDPRFQGPLLVMTLALPITVLRTPPRIMLERRFEWGKAALVDLGGDLSLYGVGITLAVAGFGVWAPVSGFVAWQIWSVVSACVLAGYRPRPRWSRERLSVLARFGFTLSATTLLNRGEDLVNPFVVGAVLGPRAVGLASFALRLGDTIAFPARASWRLALVAFGQVQSDKARLARGIEESMGLQTLTLGVAFLGVCLVADTVVPFVFGDQWRPAVDLLPFVAVRYIVLALNGPQASALYVLERRDVVIKLALMRATAAVVVAALLVPPLGLHGFGFALLAPSVSMLGFFAATRRTLRISYREPLLWAAAFIPGCFAPLVPGAWGYLLILTVVPVLLTPLARRRLTDYWGHLRGALSRRPATSAPPG